jgi:hypothetical protein
MATPEQPTLDLAPATPSETELDVLKDIRTLLTTISSTLTTTVQYVTGYNQSREARSL